MIKVLKATDVQYNNLNGRVNGNSRIEFIKDADGNWIIGKEVLTDPNWQAIWPDLNQLEDIPFNPVVTEL